VEIAILAVEPPVNVLWLVEAIPWTVPVPWMVRLSGSKLGRTEAGGMDEQ
jgi:hypothetical protein